MKTTKSPNFFQNKPLFGFDIGHGSIKVMQIERPSPGDKNKLSKVLGYGYTTFDGSAMADGILINHQVIAKAARDLFDNHLIGEITTKRVAVAIPAYRSFTRAIKLPKMSSKQLVQAVQLEAEQYISTPLEQLYLDYEIIREDEESIELFAVAVPQNIVDSYLELMDIFGLETVLIESTLGSSGRLFSEDKQSDVPTVMIDFGSLSADISIFDQKHTLVTGTVQGGGENFTSLIMQKLNVSQREAGLIKTRYGLGPSKHQAELRQALDPIFDQVIKELKRMIRYYEERYGNTRPIAQIVTTGGGANIPGLSEFLTDNIRLATRNLDPWRYLNYQDFQPPSNADRPMYTTVAGLSLAEPKEVFL